MPFEMDSTISIHAPREGGDGCCADHSVGPAAFQSTPPARGATPVFRIYSACTINFNPRPPRGGRPFAELFERVASVDISIHAPREGGDSCCVKML